MGRLFDIIQAHMDLQPYGATQSAVAKALGVSRTTIGNWRNPKELIDREHLVKISEVTGTPHAVVLNALLYDIGYLGGDAEHPTSPKSSYPA
jgi:transcriptional regulator with XRE-family HTH domain